MKTGFFPKPGFALCWKKGYALGLILGLLATPVWAQGLNFGSGDSDVPIEVYADDGIEWQQDTLTFLARGNARAIRGEVTVFGDELHAFYRKLPDGGSEIWRLDAIKNVRIVTPGETAYGDRGVYDIDNAILVLTGKKVRLVTPTDEVVADEQLEYWERKQMAVARGHAQVFSDNKNLKADVIVAYFKKNKAGKSAIHRVEAFDKVVVKTSKERATSDRGVYSVKSGIATLTGSVKIARDGNHLDGCKAEVNLNTGISKMFSCANQGGGQVGGVFNLGKKKPKGN
jgi:lipopolysaccharide export system protein LptA